MPGTLQDRVAIVTGAGRGIGQAIALKFAREGARVVVNDLDAGPAEETMAAIRSLGAECVACVGNVAATGFGEEIVRTAVDRWGGLDIIVNNAGFVWDSVIQKMTDEQWQAVIDTHLTAPFRILRAAQPVIRGLVKEEQAAGKRVVRKVVNISSVSGLYGSAGQASYSAAKAGITGLTRTLAREWGRLNVTVNCVAFGLIGTRMASDYADGNEAEIEGRKIRLGVNSEVLATLSQRIPLGRPGTVEEAAGAVYLLTIPESDYVSGQTLVCSGGLVGL